MEEKIVTLLKNKNELGLSLFKEKYEKLIRFVIGNILAGHEDDIEECLNDTYLSLWNSIETYDPKIASLKNYAVVIARNLAKNRLRTIVNHNARIEDYDISDAAQTITDNSNSVEDHVIAKENIARMQELILGLKDKYRKVLVMRYFYMMDSVSIAEQLGISVTAVDNRMYKAKKMLKKQYEKDIESEE